MKDAPLPLIDDNEPESEAVLPGNTASAPASARPRARRRLIGPDARQRQQKRLRYVLLFVSAAFMVNALIGDNGLLATVKARREFAAVQREVNALREDSRRLKADMERLKTDPSAIEEQARKDLGLIRPGETLVIIKNAQPIK